MEENVDEEKIMTKSRRFSIKKIARTTIIVLIAVFVGYIHYKYVSNLFENDRNFSYLSELEREMSFRTEMGFYYSYYKTIVEERPFIAGISKLMYDRLVEYPKDVNAFNRFNIHPEVMIGATYRYFEQYLNTSAHRQCHIVERGEGLPPVESCVGLGQPILFYLEVIWWLAGLTVAALFLYATTLSESVVGGAVAVAQYFANHAEATRVQWAPNERENLAAPLLLLQAWLLAVQLRDTSRRASFQLQVSIFFLNCLCLLFWQFTQFIFLTQTAIFFIMEQMRIIDLKALCIFLHSHFCGLHMAVLLLQGNDMLKSSLYTSFFLVVSIYCLVFSSLRIKVQNRLDLFVESWLVILRVSIVVCASFYVKKIISDFLGVQEDSHVWDILYSKFTDFKTFHTMIYTCSEVFDFLPWSSIQNMLKTFLIPSVLLSIGVVCHKWISEALNQCNRPKGETQVAPEESEKDEIEGNPNTSPDDTDDSGIENNADAKIGIKKRKLSKVSNDLDVIDKDAKMELSDKDCGKDEADSVLCFLRSLKIEPAVFYSVSQLAVFAVMAALVMRLKMLFTTQMCVVASLMMNTRHYALRKPLMKYVPIVWTVCLAPLLHQLHVNVAQEMSHVGEFTDIAQEQLLQWISRETAAGAAFAGSMPVLASVMLSTRRPVVAHPHYEHQEARQRAYAVYKTYGKFTPLELYQELSRLRATYLIVETKYCYGRSSKGCSFEDIWEAEAGGPRGEPPLCRTLLARPVDHFYPVFSNAGYSVFRIHDYSVRYMPRSFDT